MLQLLAYQSQKFMRLPFKLMAQLFQHFKYNCLNPGPMKKVRDHYFNTVLQHIVFSNHTPLIGQPHGQVVNQQD